MESQNHQYRWKVFCSSLDKKLKMKWETGSQICSRTVVTIYTNKPKCQTQCLTHSDRLQTIKPEIVNICNWHKLPFSFLKVVHIDLCVLEKIQYWIKLWVTYDSACKSILKKLKYLSPLSAREKQWIYICLFPAA